jgi:hypothetical protein
MKRLTLLNSSPEVLPMGLFEIPKDHQVIKNTPAIFDFGGGHD